MTNSEGDMTMVVRVADAIASARSNTDKARAAIQAMREPTEAMLSVGDKWLDDYDAKAHGQAFIEHPWRLMIDTALSTPEGE